MRSPATSFRLSQTEILLLQRGVEIICYYGSDLHLDYHDTPLATVIKDVARDLKLITRRPRSETHRVRMDAIAIAICMFAARSFARERRRRQIPNLVWPQTVDRRRLLRKLEKHRRRAKRLWLRFGDPEMYKDLGRRWRQFLGWVKESLRPVRIPSMREYFRRRLDLLFPIVKNVLVEETNEALPPDHELRKLVRTMLRHIRRERAPITMKDIWVCSDSGRAFIATYMLGLITKSRAQDPPTASFEIPFQSPQTA